MVEVITNVKIEFIVVSIIITLCWSLAAGAGHFWRPEKPKNLENPDFENIKHLQNLGYFLINAGIIGTI